jgi:acetyl-CoA carboxylase biotin carboxyl carrier protein
MEISDLVQLVKLLDKSGLTEISYSKDGTDIVLKKEPAPNPMAMAAPTYAPMPMGYAGGSSSPFSPAPLSPSGVEKPASEVKSGPKFKEITSPMVGTFYASSSPGSANFVQAGSTVKPGQVVCIIEAMKIMNEIESDVAGVIEEVCVSNETPVEFGTVLYRIRPA